MREIKFRGKTKVNGWVYGFLCHDWQIKVPGGGIHTVNKNTVGQYTGLKDKNGKEIYEGDIVEAIRYDGLVVTGVVGFRDCSFVISTGYQTIYTWMDYQIEIIGNIHENPELLEVRP